MMGYVPEGCVRGWVDRIEVDLAADRIDFWVLPVRSLPGDDLVKCSAPLIGMEAIYYLQRHLLRGRPVTARLAT